MIDCGAGGALDCLDQQAKDFVTRAFRGVTSDPQLARYGTFFTSSVGAVGLANATADLVDVTLSSPSYVFRDEVLTDSAGVLLPAQRLQNISYTLADAPPETLGLSPAAASSTLATADGVQATAGGVQATADGVQATVSALIAMAGALFAVSRGLFTFAASDRTRSESEAVACGILRE